MQILQHPSAKTVRIEVEEKDAEKWLAAGWVPVVEPSENLSERDNDD